MSGIYYYIWYEESMGNHALITEELKDIKENLKCKWLLMDMQYSLLRSWEGRYTKALKHVVNVCLDMGLKIMPIPHIGSGMLTPPWSEENPGEFAMDRAGKIAITEDTGITVSYYSRKALDELNRHTALVLELVEPAHYTHNGHKIVEIMEDIGYPRYVESDFNPKATYPKTTAVVNFVGRLSDYAKSLGDYRCIHKAFRDAQPYHPYMENMGLDYRKLIKVTDGEIETISPWGMAANNTEPDYDIVRNGLDFLFSITGEKMTFCTILCERERFDIGAQVELVRKYPYCDMVWFSYNEGITVDTDLKRDKSKRRDSIELTEKYNL